MYSMRLAASACVLIFAGCGGIASAAKEPPTSAALQAALPGLESSGALTWLGGGDGGGGGARPSSADGSALPPLVAFTAPWCAHCAALKPALVSLAGEVLHQRLGH